MLTRPLLLLITALASASAFLAPTSSTRVQQPFQSSSSTGEAAVSTSTADPFDSYQINTPSQQLAIRDIVVGSGDVVQEMDLIEVEYTGKLMANGKNFGGSKFLFMYAEPDRVMRGWTEGIKGMRIGGTRILRIPPRLAYGARGAGKGVIPPNSDLEFEITVLEKKEGAMAEFQYKTGFGANTKTAGMAACLAVLALSPMLPH